MKDDHLHFAHYLDVPRSFNSTNHTVRTVHTRKVDMTAFDTKRRLFEDTVHTHSHGHKDTVSDSSDLFTKSYIVNYFTNVGIFSHNDLPGTASLAEGLV